jgi:DNA-binding LytR/AlgR family response regulator
MKILLIEDEPLVAKNLESLVKKLEPKASILATMGSVKESLDWFKANAEPDLILSDIQLSDGASFDIFHEIQPKCPIIFTTAYDEYAIRAFKLNSIDYLLKPIDKDELRIAFDKFKKLNHAPYQDDFKEKLTHLLSDFDNRPTSLKFKTRFTAQFQRNIVAVTIERIVCFYRDEVIWIQTSDNQRLITDYNSLDEIEELLNPEGFFRANRQFIVNKQAI